MKVLRVLSGKNRLTAQPAQQADEDLSRPHESANWAQEMHARLRRAGLRPTLARMVAIELLQAATEPVAFADLQRHFARHQPPIPVNTAYMALRQLEEKGLVQRTRLDGQAHAFYSLSGSTAFNQSLTCEVCGQHQWLHDARLEQTIAAICQRHAAQQVTYHLEIKIRCKKCHIQKPE